MSRIKNLYKTSDEYDLKKKSHKGIIHMAKNND
jgi:hypothetical protein